jgi:hypothetical protein
MAHARIVVTESQGAFSAELRLLLADGGDLTRRVSGDRCDEVTDALEFVTAVALGLEYTPPPPPQPQPPLMPAATPLPSPPSVASPASSPRRSSHWRFLAAVEGALVGGVGPPIEPSPRVDLGVVREAADAGAVFAPELSLGGMWATSGTYGVAATERAKVTFATAALDVCPVRWALAAGFAVRPCAEADLGALVATGSATNLVGSSSQTRPWVALDGVGQIEWQAGHHFGLELAGGVEVPLLRDKFFFTPESAGMSVYAVPAVAATGRLGAVVSWP